MMTGSPSCSTTGPETLPISWKNGINPMASAARYSSMRGLAHLSNTSSRTPGETLPGEHGPVDDGPVGAHRRHRQCVGCHLDAREVVLLGPGVLRRRTRARHERVDGLASATRDHVGHAGGRGEPLVVVVVAVENKRRAVALDDRDPELVHGGRRAVKPARPGRLVEG